MDEIDFLRLDALAASLMKDRKAHAMRETGFIYWHGRRTAKCVITLRKRTISDDSHDNALRIAAMFHDVGKGIEPHAESSAALAAEFLKPLLPSSLVEEVARLICEHNNHQNPDIFVKLLQDADVLDHFGSLEVGLAFQYGAYSEQGMQATLAWYQKDFDAYIVRVHTRLRLPVSHEILDEKVAFTHAFVRRLEKEMAGEFYV